jgi:hypothetical protein
MIFAENSLFHPSFIGFTEHPGEDMGGKRGKPRKTAFKGRLYKKVSIFPLLLRNHQASLGM